MSREIFRNADYVLYGIPCDCPCNGNECTEEIVAYVRVYPAPDADSFDAVECTAFAPGDVMHVLTHAQLEALRVEACSEALWSYNRSERERELAASSVTRRFERFPRTMILRSERN